MKNDSISPDARNLEDAFFARQNAKLLERLREMARHKERREALRQVVPSADDALLDHLIAIDLEPATILALVLVPLAMVAWADGSVDPRERAALLKAAEERGVAEGSPAREMLEGWLEKRPDPHLLDLWKRYARGIWGTLGDGERRLMHDRMMGLARGVAEAAGGFLGLGNKISPAEKAILDDLEQALI